MKFDTGDWVHLKGQHWINKVVRNGNIYVVSSLDTDDDYDLRIFPLGADERSQFSVYEREIEHIDMEVNNG